MVVEGLPTIQQRSRVESRHSAECTGGGSSKPSLARPDDSIPAYGKERTAGDTLRSLSPSVVVEVVHDGGINDVDELDAGIPSSDILRKDNP